MPKPRPMPADFVETAPNFASMKALARHYNTRTTSIVRWCAQAGIIRQALKFPVPADLAKLAKTMHKSALAQHYNRSEHTVSRWLGVAKIKCAPRPKPKPVCKPMPADFAEVAPTMTIMALRRHYNAMYSGTVERWLKEADTHCMAYVAIPPRRNVYNISPTASRSTSSRMNLTRNTDIYDIAASELARFAPVYRCTATGKADVAGKFWRIGQTVVTPAELLERAERKRSKAA